jgi:hypothetical protein
MPIGAFHRIFGADVQGAIFSSQVPSRRGPSHCGQSPAHAEEQKSKDKTSDAFITASARPRIEQPIRSFNRLHSD